VKGGVGDYERGTRDRAAGRSHSAAGGPVACHPLPVALAGRCSPARAPAPRAMLSRRAIHAVLEPAAETGVQKRATTLKRSIRIATRRSGGPHPLLMPVCTYSSSVSASLAMIRVTQDLKNSLHFNGSATVASTSDSSDRPSSIISRA
jgi:hypothetical protein